MHERGGRTTLASPQSNRTRIGQFVGTALSQAKCNSRSTSRIAMQSVACSSVPTAAGTAIAEKVTT
jgi:hypothetical protein